LLDFVKKKEMAYHEIHTSGHADRRSLQKIVDKLNPKSVIPIHTENREGYKIITDNVINIEDDKEVLL